MREGEGVLAIVVEYVLATRPPSLVPILEIVLVLCRGPPLPSIATGIVTTGYAYYAYSYSCAVVLVVFVLVPVLVLVED